MMYHLFEVSDYKGGELSYKINLSSTDLYEIILDRFVSLPEGRVSIEEFKKSLMVYLFNYKDPLIESKRTIEELTKTVNKQHKELQIFK